MENKNQHLHEVAITAIIYGELVMVENKRNGSPRGEAGKKSERQRFK